MEDLVTYSSNLRRSWPLLLQVLCSFLSFLSFWDSHHDVSVPSGVLHIYEGLLLLILFILYSLDWITSTDLLSSPLIFFVSLYLLLSLSNTFFICYLFLNKNFSLFLFNNVYLCWYSILWDTVVIHSFYSLDRVSFSSLNIFVIADKIFVY